MLWRAQVAPAFTSPASVSDRLPTLIAPLFAGRAPNLYPLRISAKTGDGCGQPAARSDLTACRTGTARTSPRLG